MHKMLVSLPTRFETERLYLRSYQAGDGPMVYAVSQKNRAHLQRYEAGNALMSIKTEQDAEVLVRELAAEWEARNCFFIGVFDKVNHDFVAQIYVGPINWNLPEFIIGYIADVDHQGCGFVTEAVKAALNMLFRDLNAHRVSLRSDDTNLRSHRVAERCGFIKEGHIREDKKYPDGTISGTLHFGLLRSDYEAVEQQE